MRKSIVRILLLGVAVAPSSVWAQYPSSGYYYPQPQGYYAPNPSYAQPQQSAPGYYYPQQQQAYVPYPSYAQPQQPGQGYTYAQPQRNFAYPTYSQLQQQAQSYSYAQPQRNYAPYPAYAQPQQSTQNYSYAQPQRGYAPSPTYAQPQQPAPSYSYAQPLPQYVPGNPVQAAPAQMLPAMPVEQDRAFAATGRAKKAVPQPLPSQVELPDAPPELADPLMSETMPTYGAGMVKPKATRACDPVSNIPNFFGDFFARGAQACRTVPGTTILPQIMTFTGTSSSPGSVSSIGILAARPAGTPVTFFAPFSPDGGFNFTGFGGPKGPYSIVSNVTGTITVDPTANLNQNAELTGLIQKNFPGATFVNGTGTVIGNAVRDEDNFGVLLFNYLVSTGQVTPGQVVCVNISDPSGGGLAGRNKFFDNGSVVPQDRVYFFYNHVGDFRGLGTDFNINRYVFGVEKTCCDGRVSFEVRVPFAGTANSDQVAGAGLSVDHAEFGNLGLALKTALVRTPNFLVSAGLGVSLPTADASRLFLNGQSDIEIRNRATLLQPLLGIAWAPNDRFYSQLGAQFDFDPMGNPVLVRDTGNNLNRAGVLRDQSYAFVSGAAGYWVYRNDTSWLSRLALQGELTYDTSLDAQHAVTDGNVLIADLNSRINVVNGTAGVIMDFGDRTNLSLGVSVPLTGERLYSWNLIAQLNYRFGARGR